VDPSVSRFSTDFEARMSFKKDLRLLVKPYYLINILLSISYILSKRIPIICNYIFARDDCELDGVRD